MWCVSIGLTSARLAWQGNLGLVAIGLAQLLIAALVAQSVSLRAGSLLNFLGRCIPAGIQSIPTRFAINWMGSIAWLEIGLPLFVTAIFGWMFLSANPDAINRSIELLAAWSHSLERLLIRVQIDEVLIWIVVGIVGLGILVPAWSKILHIERPIVPTVHHLEVEANQRLFAACRNTLITVALLQTCYLFFEFRSLWFREFPIGFHYSGYAHAGASWLTAAIGFATVVLSLVFRANQFTYEQYQRLIPWAKLWLALNLVLAVCVYHRLWIYIDFNGMTRMRVVALLGVSCVVAGFGFVLAKVHGRRRFGWLVQKQLIAVLFACYLYAVMPIDWLVYKYNVLAIQRGQEAAAVQVVAHPMSSSALLALTPLLHHDSSVLREGVAALTMEYVSQRMKDRDNWRGFQLSDYWLIEKLNDNVDAESDTMRWSEARRNQAISELKQQVWRYY